MKRITLCILMAALTIVGPASGSAAEGTKRIYDKDGRLKGYVRDDGSGTKKIYDRNWNTKGYIRDDKVYDRNWNREGSIEK